VEVIASKTEGSAFFLALQLGTMWEDRCRRWFGEPSENQREADATLSPEEVPIS